MHSRADFLGLFRSAVIMFLFRMERPDGESDQDMHLNIMYNNVQRSY
jgi:hypothetical protein